MTNRVAGILLSVGVSAIALSACSNFYLADRSGLDSPDSYVPSVTARSATVAQEQDAIASRGGQSASAARMAVTHGFSLRLPAADVEAIQRKHLDECARLGCLVINTRLDRSNAGRVLASSAIRISPDAFAAFAQTVTSAPAEVISQSQTAEDKTIPLLDVEKRIEMKSALRDRLTAMLKDSSAKSAADLLAIERELAQIQGDIEAATAQRDYLRTITETVHVDIGYTGLAAQTAGIDFYPIKQAVTASGQTMAWSVAQLITFLATALPWIPLVALLAWVARRAFRRRKPAGT